MRTRLLLLFVVLLTIAGQVFLLKSGLGIVLKFVIHVADGILLASALTMLFFSFFRVGITANGELCYNPNNPYWGVMGWYCENILDYLDNPFQEEVSLCKAFWITVLALGHLILILSLLLLLIILVRTAYLQFG